MLHRQVFIRSSHPFWEGAVSVRQFRKLGTRVDDRIIRIRISKDTSRTNTVDLTRLDKLCCSTKFGIGK